VNADRHEQVLEAKRPPEEMPDLCSRLAPVCELWARLAESGPRRRVLELASPKPGEAVLEVATGTDVQLVNLARGNPQGRTVDVELADGMLRRTRARTERPP
jgi:ubiquinone/menaquinone biosynthesis C-methylase UbiE